MAPEKSEFAEFHDELRSVAGGVLAKGGGWQVLADAGWTGFEVPEGLGGAGASFAETAVICEEIGRAAAPTGYLGGLLSVGALTAVPAGGARDELLSGIAVGRIRPAVVLDGFELRDGKLYGTAEFVPDVDGADQILVVAGNALALAPAGLTVTPQPVVDETRSLATVSADGVAAAEVLPFEAVPQLRDRAAVAVACDSLGLAQAMLDATVSYVKVRHQFGRPIGSFQAVKHACADMMVSLAVSRQLVTAAVERIAHGGEAGPAASMAKAEATSKAVEIAGKAMQLHGGIGYTWESGIHVYLKRAALNRSLFGSPAAHRHELAERYKKSRS